MSFCSFIIPTIGRLTLHDTLVSIRKQSGDNYETIVNFDARVDPEVVRSYNSLTHRSVHCFHSEITGSAGMLRNEAITYAGGQYMAFVDDDDVLVSSYIDHLSKHAFSEDEPDVIIFRMDDPNLGILPDPDDPQIAWGQVGISYAVKREWFSEIRFINENRAHPGPAGNEDINLLLELQKRDAKFFISPFIDYIVRPGLPRLSGPRKGLFG